MKRLIIALLFVLSAVTFACAGDDTHFIGDDIYFVSEQALGGEPWINAYPARMTTPSTKKTKGEAEFMKTGDGTKLWTKHFWKTRIGSPDEVKNGTFIISYERENEQGYTIPPENKSDAFNVSWFLTKVTDKSTLYKGYLSTSKDVKVGKDCIRIIIK
jgi:hypothetical protein